MSKVLGWVMDTFHTTDGQNIRWGKIFVSDPIRYRSDSTAVYVGDSCSIYKCDPDVLVGVVIGEDIQLMFNQYNRVIMVQPIPAQPLFTQHDPSTSTQPVSKPK